MSHASSDFSAANGRPTAYIDQFVTKSYVPLLSSRFQSILCIAVLEDDGGQPVNKLNLCRARYPRTPFQTLEDDGGQPVNKLNLCRARYPRTPFQTMLTGASLEVVTPGFFPQTRLWFNIVFMRGAGEVGPVKRKLNLLTGGCFFRRHVCQEYANKDFVSL